MTSCAVCTSTLERSLGRNLDAALAFAVSALLLFIAANLLPFLTTAIFGVSRQSRLISSATAMFGDGFPELAIVIGLFVVALPIVRFGLLTAVLGTLRVGRRPRWLGPAFRYDTALQTWATADVFLLGCVVAYGRLSTQLSVEIETGAYCFGAAALLTLLTRATLDVPAVWRAIAPDRRPRPGSTIVCTSCGLLLPAASHGAACPRCRKTVYVRKPHAVMVTAALTIAAMLLYLPANLYPMATLPVGFTPTRYTVLKGAIDLLDTKLYGLAALVLTASFAIPLAKLAGLAWCVTSVLRRSARHLHAKTRIFRVIEEIGRWSMVDPFVIACFAPITKFNALVYGSAEAAAPAFAAVVILTTLAARSFDPRLMWDAARHRHTQ